MEAPLRAAAGSDEQFQSAPLGDLLVDSIHALRLPEDIEKLIPGSETMSGRTDQNFVFVSKALAVLGSDGTVFCTAFAVGSDGRVEARPVPADPLKNCKGAELLNLGPDP